MPLGSEELDNWEQQVDELQALAAIYGESFRWELWFGSDSGSGSEESEPQRTAAATGGGEHCGAGSCGGEELIAQLQPLAGPWRLDCSVAVQLDPPGGRLLVRLPRELPSASAAGAGGAGSEAGPAAEAADDDAGGGSGAGVGDRSAEASGGGGGGFAVRYLPPINLQLRLHPAYPSAEPPQLLSLSALWLSPAQAGALAGHLQQLWEEQGPGLPVCFTWADWLQSSALGALGAAEVLTLERRAGGGGASASSRGGSGGEGGDGSSWPEGAAGAAEAAGSREGGGGRSAGGGGSSSGNDEDGGEEEEEGGFGQQSEGPDQVLFKLLRYDAAREHQDFQRSVHTCAICFEEQRGTSFVRLDCRHAFCQGCLGEQCSIHVREGGLDALKCPEPKCGAALSPQVLQRVLAPEAYARWEQLALQRTLDRMVDAAYCPRCSTVSLEDADSCAQCPKCLFVFCSLCNESWHPGTQCVSAETRLAMLQRKAAGGGALSVQELRRREQELASLAAIEGMSKKCPRCGMAISKAEGCNKMTCGNCGAFFCFKCNKEIRGYEHYKSGECVLFDEAEILRWEAQWEDAVARVAMGEARNDFFGQQQLAQLGGGGGDAGGGGGRRERLRATNCPQCGQLCVKMGNNNHMSCWACTSHFCYLCRQVLRGRKGGTHFAAGAGRGCRQHTSD